MLFSDFIRRVSLGTQRSPQIRKPKSARRFRPTIESLEDRLAPADLLSGTPSQLLGPAVLTVNTLLDTTHSGTYLSLRDALATVNADSTSALTAQEAAQVVPSSGPYDTIVFAAGLSGTITLTSSLPEITANVQILGPGSSQLTIDGGGQYQIFSIEPGVAQVSIAGLTLANGYAVNGGAIEGGDSNDYTSTSSLNINDCSFVGNTATAGGEATDGGFGGGAVAVFGGSLNLTNSVFTDNSAPAGGAIDNFFGTMEISNDSFTGNSASAGFFGNGGAIYTTGYGGETAVQNCVFTDNSTCTDSGNGNGGAIYSSGDADLIVTNDSFTGNSAGEGGAIQNYSPLNAAACTFAGNNANEGDGGAIDVNGAAVIVDSTFANNNCTAGGGGLCLEYGTLQLTNDTLSGNSAQGAGGGLNIQGGLSATADNTIIAENTANGPTDISGTLVLPSEGIVGSTNDLIGDPNSAGGLTNGTNGNLVGVAPVLLPLGNYGGPTETMPPAASSPAIDAGSIAFVTDQETDQRGFSRTSGSQDSTHGFNVDIGAVEVQSAGVGTHLELKGPATATAGVSMSWTAIALDDNGVPASTSFGPVVMSVAFGPASFIASSTTQTNAVYGTANFSNLTLDTSGYYNIQASFGNSSITAPLVVNPAAPNSITATSGTPQTGAVNTVFAAPLVATVDDAYGNPVPNVSVTLYAPTLVIAYTTVSATGFFSNGNVTITGTTNAAGQVSETFLADAGAGTYEVEAAIALGLHPQSANFTLTNDLPATQVFVVGSKTQSVMASDPSMPLTVKVEDKNGNPVIGTVTFTVTPAANEANATFAGGLLTATVATSVVNGLEEAVAPTLTANGKLGPYAVVATVPGGTKSATFTLTNIADPVVGPSQSAVVDTKYATPFYAKVTDGLGNPIAGAIVTFTAPATGASGTFAGKRTVTVRTDSAGIATASAFTANAKAGNFLVTVGFNGDAPPETIALTNLAGPPAHVTAAGGTPQSTAVNASFAAPLAVKVTDRFGNLVAGASVTFTAPIADASGAFAGKLATVTVLTNSSGVASAPAFTANSKAGRYTVVATVSGVAAGIKYQMTNKAGSPANLTVSPAESAVIGAAYAHPLSAQVTDAYGNPVSGVAVTFTAPDSGAGGTFAKKRTITVLTNIFGEASAPAFTANTIIGVFLVDVSAPGAASGTIQMTNSPRPAAASI